LLAAVFFFSHSKSTSAVSQPAILFFLSGHGRTEREGEETSRLRAVEEHPVERRRRPVGDVDPVGEERWVAVAGAADA